MLKLFKLKSLKSNTKTGAGAGVQAGNKSRKKEKSKGRSMVEMLGVLAIIGVLSIGGISGYTLAMRRYRANEIVEVMNKYATILYTHCQMKMQNDPINYPHITSCNGYYDSSSQKRVNDLLSFTDAGLGPLPNGIIDVASAADPGGRYDSYIITSSYSHDIVEVSILLNDQKLCEVISDMMNEKIRGEKGYDWPDPCQEESISGVKGYPAHLAFYVS